MGKLRCDIRDGAGQQCELRTEHMTKIPCRFKAAASVSMCNGGKPVSPETAAALAEVARLVLANRRKMNKTETRYGTMLEARRLAGEILSYEFEAVKFRIAEKCFYTPDFFVITSVGAVELHEVKGAHIWEDARVKIKAAAAHFSCFRFVLAQYKAGNWTVYEVKP